MFLLTKTLSICPSKLFLYSKTSTLHYMLLLCYTKTWLHDQMHTYLCDKGKIRTTDWHLKNTNISHDFTCNWAGRLETSAQKHGFSDLSYNISPQTVLSKHESKFIQEKMYCLTKTLSLISRKYGFSDLSYDVSHHHYH